MSRRSLYLTVLVVCVLGLGSLFAAVNASGLVRRIDFAQKQGPVGEMQYVFSVQVTQIRFGTYGGTCRFYVELKDGAGKHYFGAGKVHQSSWPESGGYAVTYVFPVNIEGINKPSLVAYAAELEVDGVVLNAYKQNVNDLEQWKAQGAAYDKVAFGRFSFQNH